MKLVGKLNSELIKDEIDEFIISLLETDQTVKTLALEVMNKYSLDIEKTLDKVNGLIYELKKENLIK